jgi:site-specific DNA-methyltransferase (adenine-specific)
MKNRSIQHKDDWATPDYILKPLIHEFGNMFDPCPLHHNTDDWDGLKIDWHDINFVNPPYSLKLKTAFVKKAINEQAKGNTTVMLIPVSTSTALFHDFIKPNATEIRFIRGRVKFIGVNTRGEKVTNKSGMHDSMIVVFRGVV